MKLNSVDKFIPFSCDLHIHSALSPCAEDKMTPKEILKKIYSIGIDIFSITDHNSCFNCAAFQSIAKDYNLLFIPGIELQTSEEIHLLGYFPNIKKLNNFYNYIVKPGLISHLNQPSRFGHQLKINSSGKIIGEEKNMLSMPLNISINELVKNVHDFEGIAVAAHLDRGFSIISQLGFIPPKLNLDAVEVWDINKIDYIKSKYLTNHNLNIISSSDFHYLDMIRKPKMKLWLKNLDIENCINCIKGKESGKITLSSNYKKPQKRTNVSIHSQNKEDLKKDWKNLYRR